MIVYTGKQYGNEFNNGDEALFQDANRPRDEDKFKIRPGLQSGKRKWREANKDTWLPVHQYMGFAVVPSATWTYFPRVSDSWTEQEIKDCCSGYDSIISGGNVQGWTASSLLNDFNNHSQAYGGSLAYTKTEKVSLIGDANIDTLFMANSGAYIISANVILSPETAFSSTGSQFMLYMMTSIKGEEVVANYNGKLTSLNNSEIIETNVMGNIEMGASYYWAVQQNTGKNCLAALSVTIIKIG